jgi:hypothetical protein
VYEGERKFAARRPNEARLAMRDPSPFDDRDPQSARAVRAVIGGFEIDGDQFSAITSFHIAKRSRLATSDDRLRVRRLNCGESP